MAAGDFDQRQLAITFKGLFANENSHLYYYQVVDSTMTVAKQLIQDGVAEHGDVLLAKIQTGGRGRRGRAWASPEGGLWATVILRPVIKAELLPLLTLQMAVAETLAIRKQTNLPVQIKWPNDLHVTGRKVGGIALDLVCRGSENYIVVGFGINTNVALLQLDPEVRALATTLADELGRAIDSEALLIEIVRLLVGGLADLASGPAKLLDEWRELNNTLGRAVRVIPADGSSVYQGQAVDIGEDGSLIVEVTPGTLRIVRAADVSIRF